VTDDADLALLTGDDAEDLLAAALATGDEELVGWRVRQVDHRPGRSTTVAVDARVRSAAGDSDQLLGAGTGLSGTAPRPGVLRLSDGAVEVAVWRLPDDPGLPGLAVATDEGAVAALLRAHGVETGSVRLRVRSYRPRRRAVLEAHTRAGRFFLKVLRPPLVAPLARRHLLLRDAGLPVPRCLGWTEEGLLVLEALPGGSLRARLRDGGAPAPDGGALLALLDRLPDAVLELPARRSWTDEVDHYAAVTAAALPEEAERCRQLAGRVRATVADLPTTDAVHGDLYESQLLLEGARICGLLDVDTVGPGRRADDLACLLAHLHVLAQREADHRATTTALAAAWLAAFEQRVDPVDLRARVAGVVLSLATGPHRVQERGWQGATRARLDLAEHWLDRAGRTDRTSATSR
jgi:aminoglycoside phosphotransferase